MGSAACIGENLGMTSALIVELTTLGTAARHAARLMAAAPTAAKNAALLAMARRLRAAGPALAKANAMDIKAAKAGGLKGPMLDRLKLDAATLATVAEGCEQIAAMPDPVGEITGLKRRPSGISVGQMRVPLGVFGMIYESRPNVTIEAASLAIKSGNACILRGGSEAIHSNVALAKLVADSLHEADLPRSAVQLIGTTDRAAVGWLITAPEFVDVIIPRGGKGLIARISAEAKVPVIKHLDGNCHTYVDAEVDFEQALDIYREQYRPSERNPKPHAMVAINAIVADTDAEAAFLFTSLQQRFLGMQRGQRGLLPRPIEGMDGLWTASEKANVERMLAESVVGSPDTVRAGLRATQQRTGADEFIVACTVHDFAARLKSYALLKTAVEI